MTRGEPLAQAGEAGWLTDAVLKHLPSAPAHLLLLGAQPVAQLAQLEVLGYSVACHNFGSDEGLNRFATRTTRPTNLVNLTLPETAATTFAAALVLGVSPQIHPLALWDQLYQRLDEGAVVVVVGHEPIRAPPRMPKWFEYVVAIGVRCGFAEQVTVDDEEGMERSGRVRVFRKATTARWQLRHVRTRDFDAIANLFHEVFGHPISRELWSWKYANGHGDGVLAVRNGALIAHYGGMYRDVMLCGKPDWVFQICDVMVHPKERGVMTRQGPFLLTAATSAEIYGPLGFGFPNARAMEVAAKMGLYAEVGQMSEVRWQPASPRLRLRTRLHSIVSGNAASRTVVETLWAAMARDLRYDVVGVRDWQFVEHRYFSHPHNHYEVLAATSRLTGKPLGVMVLRRLDTMCELVDVIAPLANLPLLIDQARRLTGLWGLPYLYCWITKNHLQRFLATEGQETALNVSIPTSCWTEDPRADIFKNRWWLMSGDTDFR